MIEGVKITDYLERKKNYEKHMSRLQQITQRKTSQPRESYLENYHLLKQRSRRHKTDEFNKSIELGNRKLLGKIVDISTRNFESSVRKTVRSKPHHHSYYQRVRNYDIINHENPNILKRIASQSGCISAHEQQKQYERTLKLKSYIQKFSYMKNIKRKIKAVESINNRKMLASSRLEQPIKYPQSFNVYEEIDQMVL